MIFKRNDLNVRKGLYLESMGNLMLLSVLKLENDGCVVKFSKRDRSITTPEFERFPV